MKRNVNTYTDSDGMEHIQIRAVQETDLPALEWEGEYAHFRRVYAQVFQRTQIGKSLMWLAELPLWPAAGQLFVQLDSEADPSAANGQTRAYIHSFRVRSVLRGRGFGSQLLAHAEADLRGRGFREVRLQVAADNTQALRLYQRHGYAIQQPISGNWTYYDHEGQLHQVSEVGWRFMKVL